MIFSSSSISYCDRMPWREKRVIVPLPLSTKLVYQVREAGGFKAGKGDRKREIFQTL